jgi:hypothetical protein
MAESTDFLIRKSSVLPFSFEWVGHTVRSREELRSYSLFQVRLRNILETLFIIYYLEFFVSIHIIQNLFWFFFSLFSGFFWSDFSFIINVNEAFNYLYVLL